VGKLWLKIVSIQVIPPHVIQMKMGRKFTNCQRWPMKYHFRDHWQVGLSCETCQWFLMVDLNMRQISVTFMPWLLTDEQKQWHVSVLGTVGWCQKWPKLTLQGHNRRRNLGLLLWPRSQTAVLSVEKPVLSTPEEIEATVRLNITSMMVIHFNCEGTVHQICSSSPNG
jgi:hypothetical protein